MEVIHTIGRRKTAIARVYVSSGKGEIIVNGKDYKDYFKIINSFNVLEEPLKLCNIDSSIDIKINTKGGGMNGQAEASRLGIARALVKMDITYKDILHKNGMLRRDPRMVERKKPGQPKARKKFQFRKR